MRPDEKLKWYKKLQGRLGLECTTSAVLYYAVLKDCKRRMMQPDKIDEAFTNSPEKARTLKTIYSKMLEGFDFPEF